MTRYKHDPKTFRLINLYSARTANEPCNTGSGSFFTDPRIIQDLLYHYDAVGNITEIKDTAFKDVFFSGQKVEPISRYKYDSLYRLIEATGRENGATNVPPSNIEAAALINQFPCQAANAFRKYTQFYDYDAAGNIKQMHHSAGTGSWTRNYKYALEEPFLAASNRLLKTWTGSNPDTNSVTYQYDSHGSMLNLDNVPDEFRMQWDYRDMIATINLGNGKAHYQYDSSKQRTRKYLHYDNKIEERIYLGALEIYQRRSSSGELQEEIETLHLMDGDQRLLMVDQIIQTNNPSSGVKNLYRYTLSNHLGSSSLELDEEAKLISYEEYHPYGTSSYRAGRNEAEVKLKRYRYTGMERDEESGLSYHTARYYLPWLGRWGSCDVIFRISQTNSYEYAAANPIGFHDKRGLYEEPGHYYSVYAIALAVGFEKETAFKMALFSQMPDEILELDAKAQILGDGKNLRRDFVTKPLDGDELEATVVVHMGGHVLVGTDDGDKSRKAPNIADEIKYRTDNVKGQTPGSFVHGLALHAFGDSYAHQVMSSKPDNVDHFWGNYKKNQHYPPVVGHGGHDVAPDQIANRPELYTQYMKDLYTLLKSQAPKNAKNVVPQSMVESLLASVVATKDPKEQIALLRGFATSIGKPMAPFKPESHSAESMVSYEGNANVPVESKGQSLIVAFFNYGLWASPRKEPEKAPWIPKSREEIRCNP